MSARSVAQGLCFNLRRSLNSSSQYAGAVLAAVRRCKLWQGVCISGCLRSS